MSPSHHFGFEAYRRNTRASAALPIVAAGFVAAYGSVFCRLLSLGGGDAFVDPSSAVMSSPNAAPHKLASNRAARDEDGPYVPELSSGRLSAMLVVDGGAGHLMLSSFSRGRCLWRRPLIATALERLIARDYEPPYRRSGRPQRNPRVKIDATENG